MKPTNQDWIRATIRTILSGVTVGTITDGFRNYPGLTAIWLVVETIYWFILFTDAILDDDPDDFD